MICRALTTSDIIAAQSVIKSSHRDYYDYVLSANESIETKLDGKKTNGHFDDDA